MSPSDLRVSWRFCSGQDFADNAAVHIGESVITALKAESELQVVESQQLQDGGVQVVDVHFAFDWSEAHFVGGTVNVSGFDSAAGQPHGKGIDVVIAAGGFPGFAHGSASEFAAPNDESIFEQSASFEVEYECSGGLIDFAADGVESGVEVSAFSAVMVPVGVVQLDKANAAFDHAACQQAVGGEGRLSWDCSVEIECTFAFGAEVREFRGGGLHGEGRFAGFDSSANFGVTYVLHTDGVELTDGAGEISLSFA